MLYTAAEVAEILRLHHQVVQRKLQAGDLPGYRIGREWRVERGALLEWLERHSNQRMARTATARAAEAWFDEDGRLRSIPTHRSKREVVLRRIADVVEADRTYTERELNAVLRKFHEDVAYIRRELVGMRLLVRTPDGIYKRAGAR